MTAKFSIWKQINTAKEILPQHKFAAIAALSCSDFLDRYPKKDCTEEEFLSNLRKIHINKTIDQEDREIAAALIKLYEETKD